MIEDFIKNYEYYRNVSLRKYNTYKINSGCGYLIYPKNENELLVLLKFMKENNIQYLFLGNGSNVILSRPYYEVIIKLDKMNKIVINNNIVVADAGVSLINLANTCMRMGLSGLAFAGGIPGLVGASTAMNAGAYKEDMSGVIKEVKVITPELDIAVLTKDELNYGYRSSFLKDNKDYICIQTVFELSYDDCDKIKEIMDNRRQRRVDTQPLDMPSAGSVFRNPEGFSAGKLIEDIGLKGYRIGDAQVSTKHANFIVNIGNASADDIIELIEFIKKKVKEAYNIDLLLEQEIIG